MIPKKIHYCWFGRKDIPDKLNKCIKSWKKHCPDYEIIRWDENNFDININNFVREAYNRQKWAFVTDYARLWIIYHYGGFYLDTDVELIKPLDNLRNNEVYFGCEGFNYVNTGVGFGAVAKNQIIKENMEVYDKINLFDIQGNFSVNPCPFYTTKLLENKGILFPVKSIVKNNDLTIYPNDYFNPYDWATKKLKITSNTYSIHHYSATWMTKHQKMGIIEQHYYKIIKEKFGEKIANVWSYLYWCKKENGGEGIWKSLVKRIIKSKK